MNKHERVLLHNRNKLEEAKRVGLECEDMAKDIKYNLRSQSDKLENKTLKNLFGMQKDMVSSNRLVQAIKKARFKNKLIMWGIVSILILSIIFIFYMKLAPDSTPEPEIVEVIKEPALPPLMGTATPADGE